MTDEKPGKLCSYSLNQTFKSFTLVPFLIFKKQKKSEKLPFFTSGGSISIISSLSSAFTSVFSSSTFFSGSSFFSLLSSGFSFVSC